MVFSSTRPLGRRRGLALVDDLAAARAAECRIDNTAIGRARTVQLRIAVRCGERRHAYATTNQFRACNADTNADRQSNTKSRLNPNSDGNATTHGVTHTRANTITLSDPNAGSDTNPNPGSDANPDSDPNADSGAPDLQPRVHHRDGKRGVEQPHRE